MVLYGEGPANNDPDIIRELLAANPGSAEEEDANVGCSTTRIFFFFWCHISRQNRCSQSGGIKRTLPTNQKEAFGPFFKG